MFTTKFSTLTFFTSNMWNRVRTVQLFIEHICLVDGNDPNLIKNLCMRLWHASRCSVCSMPFDSKWKDFIYFQQFDHNYFLLLRSWFLFGQIKSVKKILVCFSSLGQMQIWEKWKHWTSLKNSSQKWKKMPAFITRSKNRQFCLKFN